MNAEQKQKAGHIVEEWFDYDMFPMINTDCLIFVENVRACLDMSKEAGNADLFDLLLDWVKTMGWEEEYKKYKAIKDSCN
jgi:hypothetical protein